MKLVILILLITIISCVNLTRRKGSSLKPSPSGSDDDLIQTSGLLAEPSKLASEEAPKTSAQTTTLNTNPQGPNVTVPPAPTPLTTILASQTSTQAAGTALEPSQTNSLASSTLATLDPEMGDEGPGNQPTEPNQSNWQQTTRLSQPEGEQKPVNLSKPIVVTGEQEHNTKLQVLFYSVFIVYVAFVKLIYHNVNLIKSNLTEPGILMIFGIIWSLVAKQINSGYDISPKFNSRIFFYLFLPSTVLEAAASLSNKWLLVNLFPILMHSILGTFLYGSALGFTIYSLNQQDVFSLGQRGAHGSSALFGTEPLFSAPMNGSRASPIRSSKEHLSSAQNSNRNNLIGTNLMLANSEISNLTLADCLVLGTILSSVDSATMLASFKQLQINEKLYFLTLGENLLNNAVVLIIFDLLLDFLNESRLTVVRIYFAIINFFVTLILSILMGLALASVALISIRLTKRFQLAAKSYQNQSQTMVETLLILKLAYLSYTLAEITGTSSIVSLTTFGILQDQYIKHNLNLRSQLTLRQVVLATRTLGSSLVYPLLGMLLVEVSSSSPLFRDWLSLEDSSLQQQHHHSSGLSSAQQFAALSPASGELYSAAASVASSKLSLLADQANLYWNFKFLALLTAFTLVYRFLIVVCLSYLCNLFTGSQLRIKFKEQILLAYGSLKGPLAFAMVNRLIEHEEYRERTVRNKHLFMYTILFIIFVSTILKGSFIRSLVGKVQRSLFQQASSAGSNSPKSHSSPTRKLKFNSSLVFDEINSKLTERLSSGLNSILGHTRSPYDKFADLNELTIKPWLSRVGSNTNWLSVFYDNLVLDETLNASSFYRSAGSEAHHEPVAASSSAAANARDSITIDVKDLLSLTNKLVSRGLAGPNGRPSRRNNSRDLSSLILKTIHENRALSLRSKAQAGGSQLESKLAIQRGPSATLKEFVMFNLKLEEARKRRSRRATNVARVEPEQAHSISLLESSNSAGEGNLAAGSRSRFARMLSTTSSGADLEAALAKHAAESTDEELDRKLKERHLREIELRLAGHNSKNPDDPREHSRKGSTFEEKFRLRSIRDNNTPPTRHRKTARVSVRR